ncbi:putative uncharacterized protein [Mycoplasma sp. CAG:776]|nr:putative uncharacterized protein [Mycoplasma sp. CAG:776]
MNTKINVTLSDDICFKYIFSKEEILKDFLNSFFQFIREKKKVVKVRASSNVPIYGDKYHYKVYYGDALVWLDTGEVVAVEMYRKFGSMEYKKSLAYITRLYSNQYDRGKKYDEGRKVIGINIIENNYQRNNAFLVNDYGFVNKFNYGKVGIEELEMYNVRLDLVREKVYNVEEERFIKWLKLIRGGEIEEMKKIANQEKEMEDAVRFMEEFLADEEIRNVYDKIVDVERNAREEGEEKGLKKGEKNGIIKTAKNMLKKDFSFEEISEITNLTFDEIAALKGGGSHIN